MWELHEVYLTMPRHTIASIGSEFSHRSWIRFFFFFVFSQHSRKYTEYDRISTPDLYQIKLRNPIMRSRCRRMTGVVEWCPWYICRTHNFNSHPHAPKKFTEHGISYTHTDTHLLCYSEKIDECSERWSSICAFCHGIITLNSYSDSIS